MSCADKMCVKCAFLIPLVIVFTNHAKCLPLKNAYSKYI